MSESDEMRLIKFPKITDGNGHVYGGVADGTGPGIQLKFEKESGMISTNLFFESLYGCTTKTIAAKNASGANLLTFNLLTVVMLLLGFFNMEY